MNMNIPISEKMILSLIKSGLLKPRQRNDLLAVRNALALVLKKLSPNIKVGFPKR